MKQAVAKSHPFPHYVLLVIGLCRFQLNNIQQEVPFIIGAVVQMDYLKQGVYMCVCVCMCVCACVLCVVK